MSPIKRVAVGTTIAGLSLAASVGMAQSEAPGSANTYQVPRTEFDQPDLQAVWATRFNTMLERPEGLPLVLPPEQAAGFAQAVYAGSPDNTDPDIDILGPPVLAVVKGEHRTSVVVYPENGKLPYNAHGLASSNFEYFRSHDGFDHPEQRPGVERCVEGWGTPPMRTFMYKLHHGFVQTEDKIAIVSEDIGPLRVIHMDGQEIPDALRSIEGHSVGHWEGDTLVVETTHFRHDLAPRAAIGRPMLLSGDARVSERFTRVSDTELFYEFTVDDPVYYNELWRGEFSFSKEDNNHIYEYSCHEGNYSMVGALRGERVVELRRELGLD